MFRPFWTHARQPEPDGCDTVDPLLSLYADGMTSPDESRRVESHLPDCAECRQSLLWMQATQRALSGRPIMPPPADLSARIARSIASVSTTPVKVQTARKFSLRPAYAAAASLTLVGAVVGYSLLRPHPANRVMVIPPKAVAVVPQAEPNLLPVTPSAKLKLPDLHPKPLIVKLSRPTDEHMASSGSETLDELPSPLVRASAAPVAFGKPGPKTVDNAMPVVKPHPHLVLHKKPILATPSASLIASANVPKPKTEENRAPKISPAEPNRPEVVAEKVPTSLDPVVPVKVNTPIVPHDPPAVIVASLPRTGENHFRTADLLGSVHEYVHAHQISVEHKLSLAGNGAIRATVHTTSLAVGTDSQETKTIPAIWTP